MEWLDQVMACFPWFFFLARGREGGRSEMLGQGQEEAKVIITIQQPTAKRVHGKARAPIELL